MRCSTTSPPKTALFEAVFEETHLELMKISTQAAEWAPDELELLARGLDPFLGAVLQADVQQIIVIDGPAILGLEPPKPAIARQHNALAESVNGLYKSELIDTEHEGP